MAQHQPDGLAMAELEQGHRRSGLTPGQPVPGVDLVGLSRRVVQFPLQQRDGLLRLPLQGGKQQTILARVGLHQQIDQVRRLADIAQRAGVDGVVCSPKEVAALRAQCGRDFLLVVPGIRPAWAEAGDQKRVMTPAEAVAAGADHLVIGRPITSAADPAKAARRIAAELSP